QGTANPTDYAKDVAYAGCKRAHGEPDFPDPDAQGDVSFSEGSLGNGLNPNSPRFISTNKSCQHLEPNGGVQTAADQREALARSRRACASTGCQISPTQIAKGISSSGALSASAESRSLPR
ncbi:MAG: hypothetical protein ABSG36_17515, partial [Acidimicrobiales bacterium]